MLYNRFFCTIRLYLLSGQKIFRVKYFYLIVARIVCLLFIVELRLHYRRERGAQGTITITIL